MNKSIIAILAIAGVGVVGGIFYVSTQNKGTSSSSQSMMSNSMNKSSVTIKDPDGYYNLRRDPSLTKVPEAGITIGNGQMVSFNYDGSKGTGLSYQLSYIQDEGGVIAVTGGTFEEKGNTLFESDIKVFTSNADGREGWMDVITVDLDKAKGGDGRLDMNKYAQANISLGMFKIKYEISK